MSLLKNKSFSVYEASVFLKMLNQQNSKEAQISASFYFRKKLAACEAPPVDLSEAITIELISCIRRASPEIQLNASWALTNIACGSQFDTHRIVSLGGLNALKSLIENSQSSDVRNQALWAIGNIAADCQMCRESVRHEGLLQILAQLLEKPEYLEFSSQKIAIWCLVNTLRGGVSNLSSQDVRRLAYLLHQTIVMSKNDEILCDAIWCVAYLIDHSGNDNNRISIIFDQHGLIDVIVLHLKSESTKVIAGSLRVIGNIITGTDEQTTRMLHYNILGDLSKLMNSNLPQISRESIWILSNVAAGTEEHVTMLFDVLGMAESILRHCRDRAVKKRKEAFWVLINSLMSASSAVYDFLMGGGAAHIFVQILQENLDVTLTERALQTIHHSLRDRPARKEFTRAIFRRVGLVPELCQIATEETLMPFDVNPSIAASILQEYFDILPNNNNQPTNGSDAYSKENTGFKPCDNKENAIPPLSIAIKRQRW